VGGNSAGEMSATTPQQRWCSLAYDLLLEKSCDTKLSPNTDGNAAVAALAAVDDASSTVAPSINCSRTGSDTPPLRKPATEVNKSNLLLIQNIAVNGPDVDAELESLLQQARVVGKGVP